MLTVDTRTDSKQAPLVFESKHVQMTTDYPNLLLVNNFPPNRQSGTGVTLANLLCGWPTEQQMAVYSNPAPAPAGMHEHTWQMTTWRPRGQRYLNALGPWAVRLGLIDYYDELVTADRIMRWLRIQDFNADLLLSVPRYILDVEISRALAKAMQIPLVWYIHDDWLGMGQYWRTPNGRRRFRAMGVTENSLAYIRGFLAEGVARFAICDAMSTAYQERYGFSFEAVHNPVDLNLFMAKQDYGWDPARRPFLIRYIGALWSNMQMPGFATVCDVVESMHRQGFPIELEFCCARTFAETVVQHRLHRPPAVRHLGELPYEQVPAFLSGADALIINLDFSEQALEVAGLSMPTKVAEYMASATPVLLYGPEVGPHIRYAQEEGWGLVITDPSPAALEQGLRQLAGDEDLRRSLGRRARDLAFRRHNQDEVASAFQARLRALIH